MQEVSSYVAGVSGFGINLDDNTVGIINGEGTSDNAQCGVIVATSGVNFRTVHFKKKRFGAASGALVKLKNKISTTAGIANITPETVFIFTRRNFSETWIACISSKFFN